MTTSSCEGTTALEALAGELDAGRYATIMVGGHGVPSLRVVNQDAPQLTEDIYGGPGLRTVRAVLVPGDQPVRGVGLAGRRDRAAGRHRTRRHPGQRPGVGMTGRDDARLAGRIDDFAESIAALVSDGDPRWRQGLREVPRHLFIPPAGWSNGDGSRAIDRNADEPGWWAAVYSDTAIMTQADDGATDPASGTGAPTSAASQPSLVLDFLDLLDVQDGHRVLEIGTGTGWTAALLSWRVGAGNVTTIEVDEQVAAQAGVNLDGAGYAPHLVTGDGAAGRPVLGRFGLTITPEGQEVWLDTPDRRIG